MRGFIVFAAALVVLALDTWAAPKEPKENGPKANEPKADEPKANEPKLKVPWDELFHPREVAAGQFEKWQKDGETNTLFVGKYTRVEYAGKAFWVADVHYGDGVPYKSIAIYAPNKDGSFRRCFQADSNQAGSLAVSVDAKTGMLELREQANSNLKGEVILSCNLKSVGTPYSTGVSR